MCEFCIQHGEGKKWYLQAKNWSADMENEQRKQFVKEFLEKFEETYSNNLNTFNKLRVTKPATTEALLPVLREKQKKEHWGQILPIEDIEHIIDMSISVVRVPCVCRSTLLGRYDDRYCFGITMVPGDSTFGNITGMYPDWSGDLEKLSAEDARKAFREHDRNGLVHSVWTFITPYIGGICNCTTRECLAMKCRTSVGIHTFFKAEYVAVIDWESCSGCRDCMKLCSFGAISYSQTLDRCYINQHQCYGCGVCRASCPMDAIELRDRNAIPALAEEW